MDLLILEKWLPGIEVELISFNLYTLVYMFVNQDLKEKIYL